MNNGSPSPEPQSTPPLFFALWSIRQRILRKLPETLELVKSWGLPVEISSFFDYTPAELQREFKEHSIQVFSMHGPLLRPGRNSEFYIDWAKKYLEIFETTHLFLESPTGYFLPDEREDWSRSYDEIVTLLIEVAQELDRSGAQVGYHCFPHDFIVIDEQPLVSRLFAREDVPSNLALQLDTFWLNHAGVEPSVYALLPVSSVHLNERDDKGNCCILGTNEGKCAKYIRPLIERQQPVSWILENDPIDEEACIRDGSVLKTMHQCIEQWPSFWSSLRPSTSL